MFNNDKKFLDISDKKEKELSKSSRLYKNSYSEHKKDDLLLLKVGRDHLKKSLNLEKFNKFNYTHTQTKQMNLVTSHTNFEEINHNTTNTIYKCESKNDVIKNNPNTTNEFNIKPAIKNKALSLSKDFIKVTLPQFSEKKLLTDFNQSDPKNKFIPSLDSKTPSIKQIQTFQRRTVNQFYCPFCEHCNKISDETLDSYMLSLNETKNILNKLVEFIVNSGLLSKGNFDFFDSYQNYNQDQNDNRIIQQPNSSRSKDDTVSASKKQVKDIESILNNIPKTISNNRLTYQIISFFLNSLVEEKVNINFIANDEILDKLKFSLIAKGQAFGESNNFLSFDKELQDNFDEKSIQIIKNLFKKNYLNSKYDKSKDEEDMFMLGKKFLLLYLMFLQLISEIYSECKERGVLLYKFFKLYFVEQEKKWTIVINRMKDKVKYYKDLCKTILQQKNKYLEKIETINEVLFTNKLTQDNLNQHKKLIQDLLNIINEKRQEIYIQKSSNEIMDKELNFWIYDWNFLKCSELIRKRMKEVECMKIVHNVNEEMSHKTVSREEKCMLINADIFLIASGHRSYFYEIKNKLQSEIERLNELYKKCYYKKKSWKSKCSDIEAHHTKYHKKLEKELEYYKLKELSDKYEVACQTDIEQYEMNKILKNHFSIVYFKNLNKNKLRKYIDNIKFECSKNRPISLKSLLYLIPEVFNEKIDSDNKLSIDGKPRLQFDEFFYKFMESKFKMKKLINKHCEETILSVIQYSKEDSRVDLFGKFLGIGEKKIRREILDLYLLILKSLPISFYKLYDSEDSNAFLMQTDLCLEIYFTKFNYYNMIKENKASLIRYTVVYEKNKENKGMIDDRKYELFVMSRFFSKAQFFLNELLLEYRQNKKNYEPISSFYDQFSVANKEFNFDKNEIKYFFMKVFPVISEEVSLEAIYEFQNKYYFKIKVTDFIEITLESFIFTYDYLEKKVSSVFDTFDSRKQGIIYYKEFIEMINYIFVIPENEWKLNEFFKNAKNGQEKDFLLKEEFILFCLNESEILYLLLKQKANLEV